MSERKPSPVETNICAAFGTCVLRFGVQGTIRRAAEDRASAIGTLVDLQLSNVALSFQVEKIRLRLVRRMEHGRAHGLE